jgi:hypothetical protein
VLALFIGIVLTITIGSLALRSTYRRSQDGRSTWPPTLIGVAVVGSIWVALSPAGPLVGAITFMSMTVVISILCFGGAAYDALRKIRRT